LSRDEKLGYDKGNLTNSEIAATIYSFARLSARIALHPQIDFLPVFAVA
jgi:hypothetical protein